MKPLWQQQQERIRQQQQDQMRNAAIAQWMQQKKAKAQQAAIAHQPSLHEQFAQVEGEAARMKRELAAGRLTEEQFKAQLRDRMIQDQNGTWWMVSTNTLEWYCNSGSGWVRANPPASGGTYSPRIGHPPVAGPSAGRRATGCAAFLVGLAITFFVGLFVGNIVYQTNYAEAPAWLCAGVIWLIGLVLAVRTSRKITHS